MTTNNYRGKYPHRIATVSLRPDSLYLESNAGEIVICDKRLAAAGNGGRLPKLREDIRPFRAYALAGLNTEG